MSMLRTLPILCIASLVLAACAPAAGVTPTPMDGGPMQPPSAALRAQEDLAQKLGVQPDQIILSAISSQEWPDTCLGLGRPDEACGQMIVPGYRIELIHAGKTYLYRTNQDGSSLRLEPPAEQPTVSPTSDEAAGRIADHLAQILAQQSGIAVGEIRVAAVEPVEWPDACLGVQVEGVLCAQIVTRGYRIVLEAGDQKYEFHTNADGSQVALASAPQAKIGEVVATWQSASDPCRQAEFGRTGIAFGDCGGVMMGGRYAGAQRLDELAYFASTFQSFRADTPAGKVEFSGHGSQAATPAQQRAVAEWARLVYDEAAGGRGGAAWGLAIGWSRQGGIAGFCDDLAIYLDGFAYAASCKTSAQRRIVLSAQELELLYRWIDTYKSFDFTSSDQATADSMTTRLTFAGQGAQEAGAAVREQVMAFASGLYTRKEQ